MGTQDAIARRKLIWLMSAQAVCILPLLLKLPLWIWLVWAFAVLWRLQIHRAKLGFPSFWLKLALGLGSAAGIYLTYHGVSGVDPMVGFLVCSFILKVIEMRSKKDALIVVFIGFIAVAAQFLFAQNIAAGLYGLFSLLVLLCAWQSVFTLRIPAIGKQLRAGSVLLAQSLPLMLILFVVMPRLAPLWSVPLPQGQGQTGFSETLELGDIGNLVKSPAIAFRASFNSAPPVQSEMYWRGLALDHFDGRTWKAADRATAAQPLSTTAEFAEHSYTILLEPHHHRWLFSFGEPIAYDSKQLRLFKNAQNLLFTLKPVAAKAQYTVYSTGSIAQDREPLGPARLAQLTQLPSTGNPRARELAAQLRSQSLSDAETVSEVMNRFRQEYQYTLRPPILGVNAIDDFLFSSKLGFCEHFASSFVFLMRAAGIPSRVMVGYLGGEHNAVEDYYVVRQSDAHAWAEVWLQDRGWVRVDPTAAAAPSRGALGIEDALTEDDRRMIAGGSWSRSALRTLYQRYDALEYSWNRWVLNYDNDSQHGLLSRLLGGNDPLRVGIAFVIICAALLGAYAAGAQLLKRQSSSTRGQKLLQPVWRKLERKGVTRSPHETLGQLAQRVQKNDPQLAQQLKQLDEHYNQYAYAGNVHALDILRAHAKAFSRSKD